MLIEKSNILFFVLLSSILLLPFILKKIQNITSPAKNLRRYKAAVVSFFLYLIVLSSFEKILKIEAIIISILVLIVLGVGAKSES